MTLGELLDELRNNMLRDRSEQVSGPSDQLWSDQTLIRYINDAQRRFARRTKILRDSTTPDCCFVQLQAGVTEYPLHPKVLSVLSARYDVDQCDIARAGHAALGTYHTPDSYFFNPGNLTSLPPGKVMAYSTDEQVASDDDGSLSVVTLRVYPAPTSDWALQLDLRVARLPLENLCDPDDVPEIPEDHHLDMLDWAAHRALRIADHDAEDIARSDRFKASFLEHIAEAKQDAQSKMFTPMTWGFGRNGFTWLK